MQEGLGRKTNIDSFRTIQACRDNLEPSAKQRLTRLDVGRAFAKGPYIPGVAGSYEGSHVMQQVISGFLDVILFWVGNVLSVETMCAQCRNLQHLVALDLKIGFRPFLRLASGAVRNIFGIHVPRGHRGSQLYHGRFASAWCRELVPVCFWEATPVFLAFAQKPRGMGVTTRVCLLLMRSHDFG